MPPVIARRYRPQSFEQVIGQAPIVRTLQNAIASRRLAHGFIFSGHRGIGKTTVARILAAALNCRAGDGPTASPCGECESCREIRAGSSVDVIEIDAASNRGIDEIRALRERVRYRPARDRYKFFILDEAHQLTADAFNALLKTLEEPPEWAVFVLATTEPEALPATIRSRCQHFAFRAVAFAAIRDHLQAVCRQEEVQAEPEALELIAEAGEGSVRDALSVLEQAITHASDGLTAEAVRSLLGRVSSAQIRDLLEAVADDSTRGVLERAQQLLTAGVGPAPLCWQLAQAVRNALLAQCDPNLLETSESERTAAMAVAARFGEESLTRFLQILLRTSAQLRHGQQERLHLELALLELLQAGRLTRLEDVLAALDTGESSNPAAPAAARPPAAPRRGNDLASASAPAPGRPEPAPAPTPPSRSAATRQPEIKLVPQPGSGSATAAAVAPTPNAAAEGIPERTPAAVAALALAPPRPEAAAALNSADPTAAVVQQLEREGKTALLSVLDKAIWQWSEKTLEFVFAGEHAGLAALANQPTTRKTIAAACLAALHRSPEVVVLARPDEAAAAAAATPAALPGSPEQRAEQHPLLRQLRRQVPTHILKTRSFPN